MKKQTKKIYKIATIGFLVLSMGIILFPIQRTPKVNQVQFVRNIQQLQGSQTHGSASQWDYLFEDTGQTTTTTTINTGTSTPIQQTTSSSGLLNAMQQSFAQATTASTGALYQGTMGTGTGTITTGGTIIITGNTTPEATGTKSCITPRGQTITDKDFVLAYEQRQDVTTMCNVERRICTNGVLAGSYTQDACKEDVSYEYSKVQVISQNEPVVNPLVQPTSPSNAGGNFGTNGQVNQVQKPTTMRGTTNTAETTTSTSVAQTNKTNKSCTTPRGTTVNHGQFVKSYKTSVGLLDMPCETQLRLCVNGNLKGTFLNQSCTFQNMTYNDYMAGNTDLNKPTPQDIMDTLTTNTSSGVNLFDRIRKLFE